ncbi:hypothetical protein ACP6PL_25110 [Dapis sp. BLCC M126]|uniref:hypothetical protein n=1 Tax=Dapis sp. BLCC M126 TaxID=3400189 RepID=UPI003CECAC04
MGKFSIGEHSGFIFENGFNVGIINLLRAYNIPGKYDIYLPFLQRLKLRNLAEAIADDTGIVSPPQRDEVYDWMFHIFTTGFVKANILVDNWLRYIRWGKYKPASKSKPEKWEAKNVTVEYFQCCFWDNNTIQQISKNENGENYSLDIPAKQLGIIRNPEKYKGTGKFLNSDCILLLKQKDSRTQEDRYALFVADLSIFVLKELIDIKPLRNYETIEKIISKEYNYRRGKSIFSWVGVDIGNEENLVENKYGDYLLSLLPKFDEKINAFPKTDKEIVKIIQAGSYADNFIEFAAENQIFNSSELSHIQVLGISDRLEQAVTGNGSNQGFLTFLKNCGSLYKQVREKNSEAARKEVKNKVFNQIFREFEKNFSRDFIRDIKTDIPTEKEEFDFSYREEIDQFKNTANERDNHKQEVIKALSQEDNLLLLQGAPGIGKTTAVVEFLQQLKSNYLFIYLSPRISVNQDIQEKLKDQDGNVSQNLIYLQSNSNLIRANGGNKAVSCIKGSLVNLPKSTSVQFLENEDFDGSYKQIASRESRDKIVPNENLNRGVLDSIFSAITDLVNFYKNQDMGINIVATSATQSLKKNAENGRLTLDHFDKIFAAAYDKRDGKILPQKMREISRVIPNIIIMIDEITGDDGGVYFFHELIKKLQKYELLDNRHKFNTKIIVADASLADISVANDYLQSQDPESSKIYIRPGRGNNNNILQRFTFNKLQGWAINTSSYPAKSLKVEYDILINTFKFENLDREYKVRDKLEKKQNQRLLDDIELRMANEPTIVYIQNKRRLEEIIDNLRNRLTAQGKDFNEKEHYLIIHSDILDRASISEYQDKVDVIFMTASASRGLSFKRVRHILAVIPNFEIERNLMEITQLIYRGRGDVNIEKHQEKYLKFYISSTLLYNSENRELAYKESLSNLLILMATLQAAVKTRISGTANIGKFNCAVIPVGGKAISSPGQSIGETISEFVNGLRKTYINTGFKDVVINRLKTELEKIFAVEEREIKKQLNSYLGLIDKFHKFHQNNGLFSDFLAIGKLQNAYINGGLIFIPLNNQGTENYEISLSTINNMNLQQLFNDLTIISKSEKYPLSLQNGAKDVLDIIRKIENLEESQTLRDEKSFSDQYLAIHTSTLTIGKLTETNNLKFNQIKEKIREKFQRYIKSMYSSNSFLPVTKNFENFPYLSFRSLTLDSQWHRLFDQNLLVASPEINTLSLMLSSTDKSEK